MGTRHDRGGPDPATDDRADYDYEGGSVERPAFVAALEDRIDGTVRFDEYTRQLYATDASAYEVTPIGVVYPTSTADVAAVVDYCAERGTPVLPRGGGTSLAGQAVNEAVVVDCSRHMDAIESVDPAGHTARAQVGVTLGALNDRLADHGLKFAPDPAWGDKSVLGGAIGNNSTGAHSLKYGKTDAYIEDCEVVLADGTVTTFGEVTLDELRSRADRDGLEGQIYAAIARLVDDEREAVTAAFPDLKRNVSGYNLDRLLSEAEDGSVNVARLLAGSEGTLAIVTEATVSLEPLPETKSLALLSYHDLIDAMADVPAILEHDPAAVEVLDDVLLELAADTEEFGDLVDQLLPADTGAVLLVEFYAENDPQGKQRVADLLADRVGNVGTDAVAQSGADSLTDAPREAFHGQEAHEESERKRFWKLRKSGLPILLGRTSDAKHISFIEDTAVPPENLADYVAEFQELLADNDTFASFYAHAGPGCLHIRPLVNTKTVEGVEQMAAIADGATDLVTTYGGSVSGEHGDGRARTQWNRKLYGQDVWEVFRELKAAFDPDWLLNPGQVCGYAADEAIPEGVPARARAVDMTDDLRFDPDYEFEMAFEPAMEWDNENGFQGMVELCHGCGGCRGPQETTGGVMCPTYRAAGEESTATRGRANALRQAMSGDLPADPTDEAFVDEIMDLCIGCKGCAKDCPSEVDMAKLKTEVEHAHHQEHGASLRSKLFAHVETLSAWGSRLAPLSNWLAGAPGSDRLAERLVGIASERSLPTFKRESFEDWFAQRGPAVDPEDAQRRALLVPDTYNNYSNPDVLRAAVRVLEAADVHVAVPDDATSSGRAAHSKGFVDVARERARTNVDALDGRVADGWDVVLVEPSDAVMFQSDYRDLLGSDAAPVADNAYGLCEYLDRFRLDERVDWTGGEETLTYHGHCHQKAVSRDHHAVGVLRRAGYAVDPLDSGCCGMAGSFGYEAEHYSMSQAIGRILFDQIADSDGDAVVAPGASCRTQLGDRRGHESPSHPVERLADALAD
ncbi:MULTISPECIES: FAD-binding and (Fe-S)-binding domain-containing protein [Halomicrobium]|uniref:D-lactate dehydrogenase (cytochrome) n=2 Tax=Halomicrobium mukohataei TaxID=57705 RepID=C7NYW6_HALMD|nr:MULTISPECIES: FAD-binding and (Fe-S)-binding domain-containing protein [Halomicrobium]ACV48655.1 D-lactate dehydrogenase (cytochrome) [Halomicrobium mukohataei DSM 12286]QCD64089.1 FAD-binding protein [Halomicrobium mukohataei]QFR18895.1 FAD-binding protein [Halomicrobium sp. ZPS1]